ncbi:unnamed protein product [Victoria cruziana]
MRHPHWQLDTPLDDTIAEDSLGDSLKDVQDMSLRLSVDGDRSSANGSAEYDPEEVEKVALEGDPAIQDQVRRIMNKIKKASTDVQQTEVSKKQNENAPNKYPAIRRRKRLFVMALDSYNDEGRPNAKMLKAIQETFKAVKSDTLASKVSGFALSTAMPLPETLQLLASGKIQATEFDALICGSGSEVYYPGTNQCMDNGKLCPDRDYASHIDYRWGYDGLRKTITKLMNSPEKRDGKFCNPSTIIEEDETGCNAHCISYLVKDPKRARKIDELRQKLRMRGLRCHLMYCRSSTRLQVIPLLASRSQALRYLFVRWGLNVANMYVLLGEHGDTDYEELLSGSHKTLLLKGVVEKGSEELLRTNDSYHREDTVPPESPLLIRTSQGASADEIATCLKQLYKATVGM